MTDVAHQPLLLKHLFEGQPGGPVLKTPMQAARQIDSVRLHREAVPREGARPHEEGPAAELLRDAAGRVANASRFDEVQVFLREQVRGYLQPAVLAEQHVAVRPEHEFLVRNLLDGLDEREDRRPRLAADWRPPPEPLPAGCDQSGAIQVDRADALVLDHEPLDLRAEL